MKWAHLPLAGGLYDQSPELLEQFTYIFTERSKEQERQRKLEEKKASQKKPSSRGASRGRY